MAAPQMPRGRHVSTRRAFNTRFSRHDGVDEPTVQPEPPRPSDPRLRALLSHSYATGDLPALMLQRISTLLTQGGWPGLEDMAGNLSDQAGHSSRRVREALGLPRFESKLYMASVPAWDPVGEKKHFLELPFQLPHEIMSDLAAELERPAGRPAADRWSPQRLPCCQNHEIVRECGVDVCTPLELLADATSYSHTDSVHVVYINVPPSRTRAVLVVMRKSEMCQCGCRGACSIWAISRVLAWSLTAAARGQHPGQRHDGTDFYPGRDSTRAENAGQPLSRHGVVIGFRADLAGFAQYFGFFTSAHKLRPCFLCHASRAQLHTRYNDEGVWDEDVVTADEYMNMAAGSVRTVAITRRVDARRVFAMLRVTRAPGPRLSGCLPALGLRTHDRLVPGGSLGMAAFDPETCELPLRLVFVRAPGAAFHWVSPLMSVPGFSLATLCVDVMHTVDLGIAAQLAGVALRRMLLADMYGLGTDELRQQASLNRFMRELRQWFRGPGRKLPGWFLSSRTRVALKNLGPTSRPMLSFAMRGAATVRGVLPFVHRSLKQHRDALDAAGLSGSRLCRASQRLLILYRIMRQAPRDLTEPCPLGASWADRLEIAANRYIRAWRAIPGARCVPKLHFFKHMVQRARYSGNPLCTSTHEDESFNKVVKRHAKQSHTWRFEARVMSRQWLAERTHLGSWA